MKKHCMNTELKCRKKTSEGFEFEAQRSFVVWNGPLVSGFFVWFLEPRILFSGRESTTVNIGKKIVLL